MDVTSADRVKAREWFRERYEQLATAPVIEIPDLLAELVAAARGAERERFVNAIRRADDAGLAVPAVIRDTIRKGTP